MDRVFALDTVVKWNLAICLLSDSGCNVDPPDSSRHHIFHVLKCKLTWHGFPWSGPALLFWWTYPEDAPARWAVRGGRDLVMGLRTRWHMYVCVGWGGGGLKVQSVLGKVKRKNGVLPLSTAVADVTTMPDAHCRRCTLLQAHVALLHLTFFFMCIL